MTENITQYATSDRRILKTRSALRDAMILLMERGEFDRVSVNELCDTADINRGTFYNHYQSKEDLLAVCEAEVLQGLEDVMLDIANLSLSSAIFCLVSKKPVKPIVQAFEALKLEGTFLHAVLGPNGDPSFTPVLRECLCEKLVRSILNEQYRDSDDPFVNYYIAFYSSAYFGLIMHWIGTGMNESAEEMALVAARMLFIQPGEPISL